MKTKLWMIVVVVAFALILFGCTSPPTNPDNNLPLDNNTAYKPATFKVVENSVCVTQGKPIIRLYSTTWCPHCQWVKDTFDKVAKEYVDAGKIVAHHWELDTNDDTLTPGSDILPESETKVFQQFDSKGSIPAFVFGCKYYRIGNGYEAGKRLDLEEAEFREVIERLIADTNNLN